MEKEELEKIIKYWLFGTPRVFNFGVTNSESVFHLHGYAKHLVIHNSGSSDIVVSFPDSAGKYYTIPSGNNTANPLVIPNIAPKTVEKLLLRSMGVESKAEVIAIMWEG